MNDFFRKMIIHAVTPVSLLFSPSTSFSQLFQIYFPHNFPIYAFHNKIHHNRPYPVSRHHKIVSHSTPSLSTRSTQRRFITSIINFAPSSQNFKLGYHRLVTRLSPSQQTLTPLSDQLVPFSLLISLLAHDLGLLWL